MDNVALEEKVSLSVAAMTVGMESTVLFPWKKTAKMEKTTIKVSIFRHFFKFNFITYSLKTD